MDPVTDPSRPDAAPASAPLVRPWRVPRPSGAAVFAWAVWAVLTAAALGLVNRYAGKTPYFDDVAYFGLNLLPRNATAADFWIPINEHRVPLPKLVSWATMRVGGYNLRALMRLDVALVAAGVAAVMAAARAVRGRTHFADATIPLVLLSPGQAENFLWAVQVNFLVPAALLSWAMAAVLTAGPALTAGRAVGIAVPTVLLSLCGLQGQIAAAFLALWLVPAGCATFRQNPRAAAVAVGGGAVALGLVAVCVAAYQRSPDMPDPEVGWRSVRYAVRIVGAAWGPVAEELGPADPSPVPPYLGLATAAVVALVGAWVIRACRDRDARLAATGSLAVLAGVLAVCAAVGFARGALNGWVLSNRYVTLAAPLIAWAYLAAVRFGPGRPAATARMGLFLAAVAFVWPNAAAGVAYARDRNEHHQAIDRDARRGVPPSFFVDHHGLYMFPPNPTEVAVVFEALRVMRVAPYQLIPSEPRLREVPAMWSVTAAPLPRDGWYDVPAGDRLRGVITLGLPTGARGIVIQASVRGLPQRVRSEVWWAAPGDGPGPERLSVVDFFEVGDGRTKRIWLGRPADRLDLSVEGPAAVRIERVTALIED